MPTPPDRPARAACAVLLALILPWRAGSAHADAPQSPDGFAGWPRATIEIRTREGRLQFRATVADTPARQEQGLMFVRALAADAGMWFPQHPARGMRMWMKSTLIPLDLLFVDARGRIACITERAPPESLAIISCATPVSGVLEVRGGEGHAHHVRVGDTVTVTPEPR